MTGWLEQDYSFWSGFEMQYAKLRKTDGNPIHVKGIDPKIVIEPLLRDVQDKPNEEINVFCFSSIPKLTIRLIEYNDCETTLYDEALNIINSVFSVGDTQIKKPVDDILKDAVILSKKLSENFNFVRVDWMVYKNKLYFEEMTFTPHSGFNGSINPDFNLELGKLLTIGGNG